MKESRMPDIPGLDEFLAGLPLDKLGKPPVQEDYSEVPEAVLFLKRGNTVQYVIRCFLPSPPPPPLGEGYEPKSQNFVFPGLTLAELAKKLDDALYETEILYHRHPPITPLGKGHRSVTYTLLPRQEDSRSDALFYAAYNMMLHLSRG